MSNHILSIFEEALKGIIDVDQALNEVFNRIAQTNEQRYLCVWRALLALKNEYFVDFCSHLRQVIIYSKRDFAVGPTLYSRLVLVQEQFGFTLYVRNGEDVINCRTPIMEGDSDLEGQYRYEKRSINKGSIGDGQLYRHLGYTDYTSFAQKALMYTVNNMRSNETLLACLPTGGGKSLAWQLPATVGQFDGLVIVVIPIVALAHDHQHSTEALCGRDGSERVSSAAYDGSTPWAEKQRILNQIAEGSLSILYISPEALLHRQFRECVLDAAREGKVSCLVIDEAHLVVNWGMRFRPEFQLLASFRNQLKAESPQGLRTILLSATYTADEVGTLRTIFEDDDFTEFRADMLRSELSFFHKKCQDEEEREDDVLSLVSQVPRPLIIYCFGPNQAEVYFRVLWSAGYRNMAMYTGDTPAVERHRIMEGWKNNQLDIIVATSAFGMGVDKADVRTIIHTYIPESISRYYQEVGRGGRDGYRASCYWLVVEDVDRENVNTLTRSAILTVDSIVERWMALLGDISKRESASRIWVNVNVPPEHLQFTTTGRLNANWNKDVVLFLFRLGLIDILEMNILTDRDYEILIQLNDIGLLENAQRLAIYLEDFRKQERKRITENKKEVERLMRVGRKECYGTLLVETFDLASAACSGCPSCRLKGRGHYEGELAVAITSTKERLYESSRLTTRHPIAKYLKVDAELVLTVEDYLSDDKTADCIKFLVASGVNIIVVPEISNKEQILEQIALVDAHTYMLLSFDELDHIGIRWLSGTCALIYNEETTLAERMYAFSRRYLRADDSNSIIHVTRSDHFVKSENKRLSQLVNGVMMEGEKLFTEEVPYEDRRFAT